MAVATCYGNSSEMVSFPRLRFWVMTDDEIWFFYIASDTFESESIGEAYGVVYASLFKLPDPRVSASNIKLIATSDPIAQAALAIQKRSGSRVAIRFTGDRLGPLSIKEACIYPPQGRLSPAEVAQTVTQIMSLHQQGQPSQFVLVDGTTLNATPIAIHRVGPGKLLATLRDAATSVDREVPVEDVVAIK